ncbi:MAG: N-acetyltransferase [Colwellia sp.]|nr:N-acetyltransferase [Colwellia sp.]MCW9081046.1 N-acetyltransferase [Colwellia sp.]
MNLSAFNSNQSQEVIELFTTVFSNSEGEKEGALIGKLVSELITTTDAQEILGFVATSQNKIIGCIFFSRLTFENNSNAFILSPVAVHTEHQGQGVGQQLITFGLEHLKENKVDLVFTYGDPKYYSKVGFTHVSEEHVKAPLTLTYPEGWLGQPLTGSTIKPISGASHCVKALSKQVYW